MPHTPGPWAAVYHGRYIVPAAHAERPVGFSIHDDRNLNHYAQVIADVSKDDKYGRGDQASNARLMAAAPRLLAACRDALEFAKSIHGAQVYDAAAKEVIDATTAAIAEATEQQP